MPALPLNKEQLADAKRLKSLVTEWQHATRDKTGVRPSQLDLAHQVGIDQSSMNQYLNGKIPLNVTFASNIARALGVQVRDFSPALDTQLDELVSVRSLVHVPRDQSLEPSADLRTLAQRLDYAMYRALSEPIKAAELARRTGVTRANLSLILGGTTQSLLSGTAQTLSDALNIRVEWLVTGRGDMRPAPTSYRPRGGDEFEIKQLDVNGSMGMGMTPPDHIDTVKTVVVSLTELRKQCSFSSPEKLQIITGLGQSMSPTFVDGDPLLVDTGVVDVKIDAVYVFDLDGELYIKRLQRMPGHKIRVISDNRGAFDSYDLTPDQITRMNVRGMIVLGWNARRM